MAPGAKADATTLVEAVVSDPEGAPLNEKYKALFRFVDKVNRESIQIRAVDMKPLHELGWSDEALYFAITVCALFNFYNRWIDATGVQPLSDEAHRQGGKRSMTQGYVR